MNDELLKGYTDGTHRTIKPEETLCRIQPHLSGLGVTRCADVTGLDRIGIPVYCAIRPLGVDLQVSNGKGLTHSAAKVSALMEAIELFHAGNPNIEFRFQSRSSLEPEGRRAIQPATLPHYKSENYFSDEFYTDWIIAEDLLRKEEVWLPATAVYIKSPRLFTFSSNGLASGNHLIESTLHGLYEIIERDAVSRLVVNGFMEMTPGTCRFIHLETITDPSVKSLILLLREADVKLVLIWIKSAIRVHTFMAVFLDRQSFSSSSFVNVGYGSHLSLSVAAIRAITEAAQSRLTYIHGARQDLKATAYHLTHQELYRFFDVIDAEYSWQNLSEMVGSNLSDDYDFVLRSLSSAGYDDIFRVDLTRSGLDVSVTKVIIPGMKSIPSLF